MPVIRLNNSGCNILASVQLTLRTQLIVSMLAENNGILMTAQSKSI